jgi:hypothetical protein
VFDHDALLPERGQVLVDRTLAQSQLLANRREPRRAVIVQEIQDFEGFFDGFDGVVPHADVVDREAFSISH